MKTSYGNLMLDILVINVGIKVEMVDDEVIAAKKEAQRKTNDVVKQYMRVVGVSEEGKFSVATPKGSSRKTKNKKIMTAPTPVTMATQHHLSAALAS